jgi:hypothetical protein
MLQSKFIKITIVIFTLQVSSNAMAMTPGSSKAHWEPARIQQLSPNEVHALNAAKCLVTSYRSADVESPTENVSDKPDEQDQLVLVRGEFASKGQKDLLVLCKSAINETEFFSVVWGGSNQCANKLLMSKVSRFMKARDPNEDYYGSRLEVMPASETLNFLDMISEEPKNSEQDSMGITKKWLLGKQNLPKLEHDSMAFFGHYSFVYYCNGKNWIQLYDYFSDDTD